MRRYGRNQLGLVPIFVALLGLSGCDGGGRGPAPTPTSGDPPGARRDILDDLRRAMGAPVHPADGGGRAWLEPDEGESAHVRRGIYGRWTIVYEAGSHGIDEGGTVRLTVPPYWGWSPATDDRLQPGYTEVTTDAAGVELVTRVFQWLDVRIAGRALAAGERVRFVYGAGPQGAAADRFAERDSPFWISVDGDGDGVARVLVDSPVVTVEAGPTTQLKVTAPSTLRPGERGRLRVAALDGAGNAGFPFDGRVTLLSEPP